MDLQNSGLSTVRFCPKLSILSYLSSSNWAVCTQAWHAARDRCCHHRHDRTRRISRSTPPCKSRQGAGRDWAKPSPCESLRFCFSNQATKCIEHIPGKNTRNPMKWSVKHSKTMVSYRFLHISLTLGGWSNRIASKITGFCLWWLAFLTPKTPTHIGRGQNPGAKHGPCGTWAASAQAENITTEEMEAVPMYPAW